MDSNNRSRASRMDLARTLFPEGIPTLWCPPLTHFAQDGSIDAARIRAHLRFLRPSVPALLVPGSTSEGWELSVEQEARLVDIALECAAEMDFSILVGAANRGRRGGPRGCHVASSRRRGAP